MFFKIIIFLFYISVFSNPIKKFTVVIDPGHGGVKVDEVSFLGDKFDTINQRYIENYKDGARHKKRTEMEIVLEVGKDVHEILQLTKTEKGFKKFQSYIKLFSNTESPWIEIDTHLTRKDSYKDNKFREKDDKNAKYRLYDFPDFKTGKNSLGRISYINSLKPELVLSLHINSMNGGSGSSGMGAVIAPSYKTFELLKRVSEQKESISEFNKLEWKNWLISKESWNRIENAIGDTWIYFNGYWPTRDGKETDRAAFEGYRYNMITWRYRDNEGWEKRIKDSSGPYSISHKGFKAIGKFWDRERGKFELMRREGGYEGFGGDNHYASTEILRFLQFGLRINIDENDKFKEPSPILRPYISTYSVPTFINAISAYLELGEITSDKDMYFLTKKKKKTAIAIAVGIYSLFHGLEIKKEEFPFLPKGKKIDFEKYNLQSGKTYFEEVVE